MCLLWDAARICPEKGSKGPSERPTGPGCRPAPSRRISESQGAGRRRRGGDCATARTHQPYWIPIKPYKGWICWSQKRAVLEINKFCTQAPARQCAYPTHGPARPVQTSSRPVQAPQTSRTWRTALVLGIQRCSQCCVWISESLGQTAWPEFRLSPSHDSQLAR